MSLGVSTEGCQNVSEEHAHHIQAASFNVNALDLMRSKAETSVLFVAIDGRTNASSNDNNNNNPIIGDQNTRQTERGSETRFVYDVTSTLSDQLSQLSVGYAAGHRSDVLTNRLIC